IRPTGEERELPPRAPEPRATGGRADDAEPALGREADRRLPEELRVRERAHGVEDGAETLRVRAGEVREGRPGGDAVVDGDVDSGELDAEVVLERVRDEQIPLPGEEQEI